MYVIAQRGESPHLEWGNKVTNWMTLKQTWLFQGFDFLWKWGFEINGLRSLPAFPLILMAAAMAQKLSIWPSHSTKTKHIIILRVKFLFWILKHYMTAKVKTPLFQKSEKVESSEDKTHHHWKPKWIFNLVENLNWQSMQKLAHIAAAFLHEYPGKCLVV